MTDNTTCCAGIDVAKAKLDIALHPGGEHIVVDYTQDGLAAMDRFLANHKVARIGFEASGGYELRLLAHLRRGAIAAARFQPGQVKAFAKSRLRRAKNDRLDALLIAAFTASLPELPPLPDPQCEAMAGQLTYVEQLEDRIVVLRTMLEATRDTRLRKLHGADIKTLEKRRARELTRLAAILAGDAELTRRMRLLLSIPGIGERTALAIVVRLPEIGSLSREQVAALAGLAPFDNDTATRQRQRHIAGGRHRLRKSLFMAAFCASRWNSDLNAFYARLRADGKTHLCAVIATARKLIVLANTIVARNSPWTPFKPQT